MLAFALAAVLLTRDHQAGDSPTLDEPLHVFASAEYVMNGTMGVNLEHPPLMKLLAGLSLKRLKLTPPAPGSRVPSTKGEYFGFLYGNYAPADFIVDVARRPFPWLLAALIVLAWAVGNHAFGAPAGLLAAGLLAFEPSFVGHAGVVHTDVGAALMVVAALSAALVAAELGRWPIWIGAGLLLGLALATKFSAVLLLPLFPAAAFLPWPSRAPGARRRALAGAAVAVVVGIATLAGVYAVAMRRMSAAEAVSAQRDFLASRDAPEALVARVTSVSRVSPQLGNYLAGLEGVALLDARGRGANFLRGRVSSDRFPSYFFVAFLVKSTPAFLILTLALFALGGRRLLEPWPLGLLVGAVVFFAAAVRSHFNIGIRHVLPVYALLAIVGAGVLRRRLAPRVFAWGGAVLVATSALSTLLVHPEEIAYFNVIAGGPAGGTRWLTDSNVDWGQDMKRLGAYLRRTGTERETTVVAYSGLATNYYNRACKVLEPYAPLASGRYAVSALIEAIGPEFVKTFEGEDSGKNIRRLLELLHARGRRVDRVGASITIWELPPP